MALAASSPTTMPAGEPLRPPLLAAQLVAAPDLFATAVAGFAAPAMILLLLGHFSAAFVLPLGTLGAVVAVLLCRAPAGHVERRAVGYTLAAAGIAVVWCVVNVHYSAENLFAHRDPATYGLTARWLVDHSSLPIHTQPDLFGRPLGYNDTSAGFGANSYGTVYPQGNHLLPALLAAAGWLFGAGAVLKANVGFAAVALFVFFGLARRAVSAPLALAAMGALALSMPMLYVSRDTYSEPLALLLLMAGISLLHRAILSGRVVEHALAGFVAGSAAVARIDSDVSLLALLVVAVTLLAVAPPGTRVAATGRIAAMLGAAVPMVVLGWLDVTRLSSGYYRDERHQILPIGLAAVGLCVLGAAVVGVAWVPSIRARLSTPRLWLLTGRWAAGLVVAAFVLLLSRPLWLQAHGRYNSGLRGTQELLGLPVDGTRLYNEHTLNWQAMYFGWPTVVLAVIGYVLLLHRVIRHRELALLGVLTMGLAMSVLYLWSAEITPDQPWAMRRYLPVVIPVLLVAAVAALRMFWMRATPVLRLLAGLGGVVLVGAPLLVTAPVATLREEVPQLSQVRALCAAITPNGAVVAVDNGARESYLQTVRSYCDVPAIGLIHAQAGQLAAMRTSVEQSGRTLYALSTDVTVMRFADSSTPAPFHSVTTSRWPSTIDTAPRKAASEVVTVYLATVRPDGLLVEVPPP